jgi:hypothetical protein
MGARLVADLALEPSTHFETTTGEDVWAQDQHHVPRFGDEWVCRRSELNLGR